MGNTMRTGPFLLLSVLAFGACQSAPAAQDPQAGVIQVAQVEYGLGRTVNLFVILPTQSVSPAAPVVMAFPWGAGTGDLMVSLLRSYWDVEAPGRGYIVVGVQALGPDLAVDAGEMIPAVFSWMNTNLSYDPTQVVATGASNGGRGLFHAVVAVPDGFSAMVGMPGEYSGDAADLQPLAGKPAWLLVGERDTQWRALAEDTRAKLESQGVDVTLEVLPGQDHVLDIAQTRLLDWIDAALGR